MDDVELRVQLERVHALAGGFKLDGSSALPYIGDIPASVQKPAARR